MRKSYKHCAHCYRPHGKCVGEINRAKKEGRRLFCSKKCFGLDRRTGKTKEQKVVEKRMYDIEYRHKNLSLITARKAAYFQRTYDPAKAAIERKKNMHRHVAYCRRPEYRAKKRIYDEQYRAKRYFGEFWESAILVEKIRDECLSRMTRYEIALANGLVCKSQKRRRNYESSKTYSRKS